jgi:nucleotide-binding universal stress UspA family protein
MRSNEVNDMAGVRTIDRVQTSAGSDTPQVTRGVGGPLVVGVDGSDESVRALIAARRLASLTGARIIVVFVRHQPPVLSPDVPGDWVPLAQDAEEEQVRALAARWLVGLPSEVVVAEGGIAQQLERVAAEAGARVLIVGSSHGGVLRHLWEGSGWVTTHAVRASVMPVLVAR